MESINPQFEDALAVFAGATATETGDVVVVDPELGMAPLTTDEMEAIEAEAKRLEEERQLILSDLARSVDKKFRDVQTRRTGKEGEWMESMRLYHGSVAGYGPRTTESYFRNNDTNSTRRPDHNLVKSKCLTAIAQCISQQFSGGDKNWDLNPPLITADEGSPEQQQAAEIATEAMEGEINDQLTATKYGFKCREAMKDRVILGTGILKGPVPEKYAELTYRQEMDPATGQVVNVPEFKQRRRPVLQWVDPWMFFPDDSVNCIEDAEFAIELHPMSSSQLRALAKNPGFFPEAIKVLLEEEPFEYINQTLSSYGALTNSNNNIYRDKYSVLEYHGPVTRTQLDTLEICPAYESPSDTYYGEVWVCQGKVLRVELATLDGVFELPYAVCPWEADPGCIFGFGLPQILKDSQRIATQTLHMILDNASASSGSSVILNSEMVEPMDGSWQIGPRKIWKTTDYNNGDVRAAFAFIDIPNQTQQLMPVFQMARELSQEESALPQMVQGLQSAQAGSDSATGLAILQQNSTIVSDYEAEVWDDKVTEKIIRRMYHWNMQYGTNPQIMVAGVDVDVRSSTEYRARQMQVRDIEKLSVESAQNPALAQIINQDELQRTRLAMLHLPSKLIVKSNEQIRQEQEEAAANPPPDPALIELQLREREVGVKEQQLQLEMAKLQQEASIQQQREIMEHQERMASSEARMREAEARVLESATLERIEYIKLAQSDELGRAKIMADLDKATVTDQRTRFLAGIAAQQKAKDQAQTDQELKIKREKGTGI